MSDFNVQDLIKEIILSIMGQINRVMKRKSEKMNVLGQMRCQ